MELISLSDARRFSLTQIERRELVGASDLQVEMLCFEAGQRGEEHSYPRTTVYQVLEGEALVRAAGENRRLGKGKLLSVDPETAHRLENAGGGLLVMLASRAR